MKNSITITKRRIGSCAILMSFLLLFGVSGYVRGQVMDANGVLRFGDGNLNPKEQALLQEYLDNYDNLTDLGNGYPPTWDNPEPQDKPHGIIVALEANPRINDIPLDKYDYIGGFYTDDNGELRCGGAGYWPDSLGIVFALHKDNPDTPEKDGFAYQEQIYFKLFSFSTMKDYLVDVTEFDPEFYGTDHWGALGLSRLLDMQALKDLDFYIEPSGNPICTGNELTLSGQEFIGTGGNYTFQWTSDPPGFDYNTQFPPSVVPETTTTYNLVVQDGSFTSEHSLTITVENFPAANAGQDGQLCANESFALSGEAQNFNAVNWTTSGDGVFEEPDELQTSYIPGPDDISGGEVTLSLTALPLNPCDLPATDNIVVEVLPLPGVNAGEDIVGCTTEDILLDAIATNYSTAEWSTSGSGYFLDPNDLNTTYIAGGNDFQNGVTLTVCAQALNPCTATACDEVHVEYVPGPTAYGMTSNTGCENNSITVSGIAYNYSTSEWTTAGDGTFQNPALFSTKYYPGPQDIQNGGVIVTLNAYPIGNCDIATKDVQLNIVNLPVITFGQNAGNICMGDEFMQLDATVQFSNSVLWSTNGDGTFSNSHIAAPKYYPGPQDEQNGQFELELLAYPLPYCAVNSVETLQVTYQDNPQAFAGQNTTICENETYSLMDATAESYGSLLWSAGNGVFSDPSALHPEYIPGPEDFGTTISVCLSAAPISPCDVAASDCMDLTIVKLPVANAGMDDVICETDNYQLTGSVSDEVSIEWVTNGDGTFSDPAIENPVYTPGTGDIAAGDVTLTLNAQPNAPCTTVASDNVDIQIAPIAVLDMGTDIEACASGFVELNDVTADNYSTVIWTTSGDGTFSDPQSLNPVYYPGTNDLSNNQAELTLTLSPLAPCVGETFDTKTLFIAEPPVAYAGDDITICADQVPVSGTAENYTSVIWTTTGDGTFDNPVSLNAEYFPGSEDMANGNAVLTFTADAIAPCTNAASDNVVISFEGADIEFDNVTDKEVERGNLLSLSFGVNTQFGGTYHWYFNGELLAGQNNPILLITDMQPENAGNYQGSFTNDCGTVETNTGFIEVVETYAQEINVNQGWSGISSFVTPDNPAMEDVFAPIAGEMIILSNNNGVYWPGQNMNTLGDFSVNQGYQVKMANGAAVSIDGKIRYPISEISIQPGWSYLPVNTNCPVDVAGQFGNYPEIALIKDIAGTGIYWPGLGINSLNQLLPGSAYMILNTSAEPVVVNYDICDQPVNNIGYKTGLPTIENPWNVLNATGSTHVFGFDANACASLETGDVIGAFGANGTCTGLTVADQFETSPVVVFGDDPMTDAIDGMSEGEEVSFMLYRPSTGEILELNAEFDASALQQGTFVMNGVSVIRTLTLKSAAGIGQHAEALQNISIYPNPTSGTINISAEGAALDAGKVILTNAGGQVLMTEAFAKTSNLILNIDGYPKGVYYLKIAAGNSVSVQKVILK